MEETPIAFELISHAGTARSFAIEAMSYARETQFDQAEASLEEAKKEISAAHRIQTDLIQEEARGNKTEFSLLLIHAQDHLMNAITIKELASEFVHLYKKLAEQEQK